jgi:hypothetical protein
MNEAFMIGTIRLIAPLAIRNAIICRELCPVVWIVRQILIKYELNQSGFQ